MSYFRDNIEQLAGYTPGFQPKEAEVVKLNTNENPYPPSPAAVEVLRNFNPENLRRYPSPLGDSFREAAAEVNGVSPDNIMCTNGGDDLLTICFRCFTDETKPVCYPTPTYTLYEVLAKIQNTKAIEVPFNSDFSLPMDDLVASNAGLVIVCNPNAPTGTFISPEIISELAGKLQGKSILLIDEAYADFAQGNCVELINKHDNVIILRSMSKGYSLAGLRFGYAIASEPLIDGLRKVKDSYNTDALANTLATAAIKDREYFNANVVKVKSERARLTTALSELGFSIQESQTNFLLACAVGFDAAEVFESLKERLIFVRYFPYEGLSDKLRITVGTKEENDKLIAALKEILNK